MAIRFYDVHAEPHGGFSNFSKHDLTLDQVWYATAEHAFQSAKFAGSTQAETIRKIRGAKDAARMARDCRSLVRKDWDEVKDGVMGRVLRAKFSKHESLRDLLVGTGSEPIEFASPMDGYWGIGRDTLGLNRMGRLLEELRDSLRSGEPEGGQD